VHAGTATRGRRIALAALLGAAALGSGRWWRARSADSSGVAGDVDPGQLRLEVRWHNGQVVINGHLPSEVLQRRLFSAAQARVGGDAEQVIDLVILRPDAAAPADVAAVCELIGHGVEGWLLRWTENGAALHGEATSEPQRTAAGLALRDAFAPATERFAVNNALVVR
jgi:hypothetical protein